MAANIGWLFEQFRGKPKRCQLAADVVREAGRILQRDYNDLVGTKPDGQRLDLALLYERYPQDCTDSTLECEADVIRLAAEIVRRPVTDLVAQPWPGEDIVSQASSAAPESTTTSTLSNEPEIFHSPPAGIMFGVEEAAAEINLPESPPVYHRPVQHSTEIQSSQSWICDSSQGAIGQNTRMSSHQYAPDTQETEILGIDDFTGQFGLDTVYSAIENDHHLERSLHVSSRGSHQEPEASSGDFFDLGSTLSTNPMDDTIYTQPHIFSTPHKSGFTPLRRGFLGASDPLASTQSSLDALMTSPEVQKSTTRNTHTRRENPGGPFGGNQSTRISSLEISQVERHSESSVSQSRPRGGSGNTTILVGDNAGFGSGRAPSNYTPPPLPSSDIADFQVPVQVPRLNLYHEPRGDKRPSTLSNQSGGRKKQRRGDMAASSHLERRECSRAKKVQVSCIRCKLQHESCDMNHPNRVCTKCQKLTPKAYPLECFPGNLRDLILFRTGSTLPKFRRFPLIGEGAGAVSMIKKRYLDVERLVLLTQHRKAVITLTVNKFEVPEDTTEQERPIFEIQWGLFGKNYGIAKKEMEKYVDSSMTSFAVTYLSKTDALTKEVFKMASAVAQAGNRLLITVLRFWTAARCIETEWHVCSAARDGTEKSAIPEGLAPVVDHQLAAITVGSILEPQRSFILAELDALFVDSRSSRETNWLAIFLTTYILLHHIEVLFQQQREFARARQSKSMFTNVALIRGLIRAADGILGHYVAACRASPFHMCRAVADTKEKAFFEAIIRHEQLHRDSIESASSSDDYAAKFYFTGQMFKHGWKPKPASLST